MEKREGNAVGAIFGPKAHWSRNYLLCQIFLKSYFFTKNLKIQKIFFNFRPKKRLSITNVSKITSKLKQNLHCFIYQLSTHFELWNFLKIHPRKLIVRILFVKGKIFNKILGLIGHRRDQMEKELRKDEEGSEGELDVGPVRSKVVTAGDNKAEEAASANIEDLEEPKLEEPMEEDEAEEKEVVKVRVESPVNRTVESKVCIFSLLFTHTAVFKKNIFFTFLIKNENFR